MGPTQLRAIGHGNDAGATSGCCANLVVRRLLILGIRPARPGNVDVNTLYFAPDPRRPIIADMLCGPTPGRAIQSRAGEYSSRFQSAFESPQRFSRSSKPAFTSAHRKPVFRRTCAAIAVAELLDCDERIGRRVLEVMIRIFIELAGGAKCRYERSAGFDLALTGFFNCPLGGSLATAGIVAAVPLPSVCA